MDELRKVIGIGVGATTRVGIALAGCSTHCGVTVTRNPGTDAQGEESRDRGAESVCWAKG